MTTNWGCNWCLNENICLFNTSKCERGGASGQLQRHQHNQQTNIINTNDVILLDSSKTTRAANTRAVIQSGPFPTTTTTITPAAAAAAAGSTNAANTIGLVGQCPTFDLRDKQEILIPDGSEQRELSIRVKNMPQVKVSNA